MTHRLDDVNLTLEELISLFPIDYKALLCHLARHLSVRVNLLALRVLLLDVLLVLTIFSRGPLAEKSIFLFELFNYSGRCLLLLLGIP
jgi:hypothetical protein